MIIRVPRRYPVNLSALEIALLEKILEEHKSQNVVIEQFKNWLTGQLGVCAQAHLSRLAQELWLDQAEALLSDPDPEK